MALSAPPITPTRGGSTPAASKRATFSSGPMASSASARDAATSWGARRAPDTTGASTSVRAISARRSVSPSTVLTPTSSTSACPAAQSNATASSGFVPTSVSIHNRTQRLLQRGVRKLVPGFLETLRQRPLALDEQMLDQLGAVPHLQWEQRRRQHSQAAKHAAERLRELGVRNGCRRGDVHGTDDGVVREGVQDGGDLVVDRDPAHVLAPGRDPATEAETKRQQHARQHAALAPEDHAASRPHDADACLRRGSRRRFPLHAHAGDEVAARRAPLVERLVASIAVVPDRRRRDDYRRAVREPGKSAREETCALRARFEDQAFPGVGPPLVADAGTSEVDDGADPFEAGDVDRARLGVPAQLVGANRLAADEPNRAMTGAGERGHERRADEPVRPGDRDVHADSMDAPSAPSSTG